MVLLIINIYVYCVFYLFNLNARIKKIIDIHCIENYSLNRNLENKSINKYDCSWK